MTTIHVSDAPDVARSFADFFDGRRAVARRADIKIAETPQGPELVIDAPDRDRVHWRLEYIRGVPDQAAQGELVLAHAADPLSRLVVRDPDMRRILTARCRNLKYRPPVRGKGRLALWAGAAVGSVALIIFVLVPVMANQLAEFLPPRGERALGETTFEQIRAALDETGMAPLEICEAEEGRLALERMASRLTQQVDLPYPVNLYVLNHDMVNAFALPGGLVILFRGLIDAAEDADEVAAVVAHEIGHVAARDPTRIALRSAGSIGVLGLLLGDFAGGSAVLFLTERLIQATYTQEAEAQADAFAHRTLSQAGIPPSALGRMFRRLRDRHGDATGIIEHFASHPALGDRIAQAEAADSALTGALRPALSDAEWRALRRICGRS